MIDTTMQQLTLVRPHMLEWREVPTPKIVSPNQAIVRPMAVARCDLDLYMAVGAVPLRNEPFAIGHEIAGEVIDVGENVRSVKPGDSVIVPFQINCGICPMCISGKTNSCINVPAYSAYGLAQSSGTEWGGGLSDFLHVPFADAMLVPIPEEISWEAAAALSDNAVDGFRTVAHPLKSMPGSDVLVVGGLAQSIGLFAVQAAIALGAKTTVYTDYDGDRLARAKKLGADTVELRYEPDLALVGRFPIVVDASNMIDGLLFALRSTAPSGTCTSVSAADKTVGQIPLQKMYMDGISFNISRVQARSDIPAALECARCGTIDPTQVISTKLEFTDASEAMTDPDVKIVFTR